MNRRTPSRTTSKAPARTGRGPSGRTGNRNSATLNVTGLRLGSLITFNFGGGRGRRGGGGLFARLRKTATSTLSALKGADYSRSTRAGSPGGGAGRGSFDRFRASRPDLFDPDEGEDLADGDPEDGPAVPAPRPSRTWDGSPESDRDRRFFDLRESGYRGPIDQDGYAVAEDGTRRAGGGR